MKLDDQKHQCMSKDKACVYPQKVKGSSPVTASSSGLRSAFSVGCVHGPSTGIFKGNEVPPIRTPAEGIGYGAATPAASAYGNSSDLVRAKTAPTPAPGSIAGARYLESPSSSVMPLTFGRQRSRSTPMASSSSDATGGFDPSDESETTATSATAGRAFTFGETPGEVGGTRPQAVTGKPVVGGVTRLPSPALGMATPIQQQQQQQQQWRIHHRSEKVVPLPPSSGGPRDTSALPATRLAVSPSARAPAATRSASSQSSTIAEPALESFGNGVVGAAGKSGSVAQGGITATGNATTGGAGGALLRKRAGAVDAAAEGATRQVDLVKGGHTIVLFDVETTGLDCLNDHVIQLAGKVRGMYVVWGNPGVYSTTQ